MGKPTYMAVMVYHGTCIDDDTIVQPRFGSYDATGHDCHTSAKD